jgi:hypothetical protein
VGEQHGGIALSLEETCGCEATVERFHKRVVYWSNTGQTLVKHWSNLLRGANGVGGASFPGVADLDLRNPILVKYWSNTGGKYWSNTGVPGVAELNLRNRRVVEHRSNT